MIDVKTNRTNSSTFKSTFKRIGLLLVAIGVILLVRAIMARPTTRSGPVGALSSSCQKLPGFASKAGITNAAFDTSRREIQGLVVYDADKPERFFQHPSWKAAGSLGPLANDEAGDVFVAPVPSINTLNNPPKQQNTIYKVDSQTGVMTNYYELENVPLPDQRNPYGIISLAYDCQTKVLYATSISGSNGQKTSGSITAINTESQQQIARLQGIDALSAGLFRDKDGAHLYYGLAGSSQVWRVGLSDDGRFSGKPRYVLGFDKFNELKPRKLVFRNPGSLQIDTTEFRYNLVASTEYRQEYIDYKYSTSNGTWQRTAK